MSGNPSLLECGIRDENFQRKAKMRRKEKEAFLSRKSKMASRRLALPCLFLLKHLYEMVLMSAKTQILQ